MGNVKTLLRFWRLPRARRRLLVQAAAVLALVRVALLILPFKAVAPLARKLQGRGQGSGGDAPTIGDIVWAVGVASRRVTGGTCLTQALAGSVLLARNGYPSDLRIGVRRDPIRGFEAHAWLERDGDIVLGQTGDQTPFIPLSAPFERPG